MMTMDEYLPYLRAWERHGIHFGVACSRSVAAERVLQYHSVCLDAPLSRTMPPLHIMSGVTLKIVDDVFWYRFPHGHPHHGKRGMRNERFLNATDLNSRLVPFLTLAGNSVERVILSVEHVYRTEGLPLTTFLERLCMMLDALPPGPEYAVAIHNRDYLLPAYFACLQQRGIAHVLAEDGVLPAVLDQIQLPHVFTAATVLLLPGPVCAETQLGIVETVRRCIDGKKRLYVCLPDGATGMLAGVMQLLNRDLAGLSPIRKYAA